MVLRDATTSDWLDEMDRGSTSAAGIVAAFSDRLGPSLDGSVICPHAAVDDFDCDGVGDAYDRDYRNFLVH